MDSQVEKSTWWRHTAPQPKRQERSATRLLWYECGQIRSGCGCAARWLKSWIKFDLGCGLRRPQWQLWLPGRKVMNDHPNYDAEFFAALGGKPIWNSKEQQASG